MKNIVIFFICFFSVSFLTLNAQDHKAQQYYEQGKKYYDDDMYKSAITSFKHALEREEYYDDALYYLGSSYYYDDQYENAIDIFKILDEHHPDYWAYFYYIWGRSCMLLDKLKDAIPPFEEFLKKYPTAPKRIKYHHWAKYMLVYCKEGIELRKMEATMSGLENLGGIVNSLFDDYTPQIDPTGKKLYITSQRQSRFSKDQDEEGNWGEDVYVVEREGYGWGEPKLLPEPINSTNNDFGSSFSGDGQTMVYVKCNTDEGIGNCDLYITYLEGNSWSEPENMGNIVNSEDWDSQPSISADGTKIIFTSQRPGGYGGADLYMITKNRFGDWGIPQNMGPVINTPWTEKSPYIAPDGKTLYFSSYGHPGFGEADLFISTFENGTWSKPVNLGKPLNSAGNDNYFTISASGKFAYFASTREGGEGMYDIYKIDIPEELRPQPTVVVSGIVTDAKTKDKLNAWVLIEDMNNGELIATNKSNSETGEYLVVLPAGRRYAVTASKEGYFFFSQSFEVTKKSRYQEVQKDIALKPIEKGARVILNNIFFETGQSALSPDSRLEMNKAVGLMEANPSMVIEVGGHTDNVGNDAFNMNLSLERARSVRQFLLDAGIDAARIQAKGYGETKPVADNNTEEGRAVNRRTEFTIVEF